ncbi:MAG: AAA family ATPase [Anaerolineae bacterium]|nr:AAA family ATPase [Anaerolineae bacterium]
MGTIIALVNQKGGVGKTTTAINLGAALAEKGMRVLLVDLDPQGALSNGLGIQADDLNATIYNLLTDTVRDAGQVILRARERIDLLPANIDLAAAELELVTAFSRESLLKEVLAPLVTRYDFILIDCGPNLGLLTVNGLTAADVVLIPLQCEYFALRALGTLMRTIARVRARLNPKLQIAGIFGTMYATGTRHAEEVLRQAGMLFDQRVFDFYTKKSIRFAEASAAGKSILEYAPDHEGAHAYRALAEVMIHDYSHR